MCLSSSKSSQSSDVTDNRIGADNGSLALRTNSSGSQNIVIGSDDVAQFAIESSTNALTTTTDLIGSAFSDFLSLTDRRLERAEQIKTLHHNKKQLRAF